MTTSAPAGSASALPDVNHEWFSADRLLQLKKLRSDEFCCAADGGAADATSDKDASVIEHSGRVILSRLGHCAKQSELSSCGIVHFHSIQRHLNAAEDRTTGVGSTYCQNLADQRSPCRIR